MEVLIADSLAPSAVPNLEALGITVRVDTSLKGDTLAEAIGGAEILVVRSTKVNRTIIDAAPELALIIRAGAGVNTIDMEAAGDRGIYVANCPGKNTKAVAELALGLIIATDRRIVDASADLRAGRWRKGEYGKSRGLAGRTLGIVGLGSIGRALAQRARGLEMEVAAWSRSLTPQTAAALGVHFAAQPTELATMSDVVSVHLAGTEQTKRFLGRDFFAAMRPGGIFVNTARGDVVDSAAMFEAASTKGIKLALDVYDDEPASSEAEFAVPTAGTVGALTPHIGASTDQSREAVADEVVAIVESFIHKGHPVNAVNLRERTPARHILVVRHHNRVGVLAGVLQALRQAGINIEEMENTIFEGGTSASCILRLDDEADEATRQSIRDQPDVIRLLTRREE